MGKEKKSGDQQSALSKSPKSGHSKKQTTVNGLEEIPGGAQESCQSNVTVGQQHKSRSQGSTTKIQPHDYAPGAPGGPSDGQNVVTDEIVNNIRIDDQIVQVVGDRSPSQEPQASQDSSSNKVDKTQTIKKIIVKNTSSLGRPDDEEIEVDLTELTNEQRARIHNIINFFANKESAKERMMKDSKTKNLIKTAGKEPKQRPSGAPFYFKEMNKKFVVYDERSLWLFHHEGFFRQKIVWLSCWPQFENFINAMILVNSVFLACVDFETRDDLPKTTTNAVIEQAGEYFSYIFICELVVKVIAMGFVVHRNSYLRDTWNWLDFLVVCISIVQILKIKGLAQFKALRTMRVLRPLRSINAFPSMKRLIGSLLAALPSLADAIMFMLFIFVLFGILGVQQFKGTQYQRCREAPEPDLLPNGVPYRWTIAGEDERLCPTGDKYAGECGAGYFCGKPEDFGMDQTLDGVADAEFIMFDIVNFNNLGSAMIIIFQMITLEGWTTIMYNLQDSSEGWMAVLFCVSIVVFGAFFLLQVILVVIMGAFDDVDANQNKIDENLRAETKELKAKFGISDSSSSSSESSGSSSSEDEKDGRRGDKKKNGGGVEPDQSYENQQSSSQQLLKPKPVFMNKNDVNDDKNSQIEQSVEATQLTKQANHGENLKLIREEDEIIKEELQGKDKNESKKEAKDKGAASDENGQHGEKECSKKKKKSQAESLPERAANNPIYRFFYWIVSSNTFGFLITVFIVVNTVVLSLDFHPMNSQYQLNLDTMNEILTWIFIGEMVAKLTGLGFKAYASDSFNLFDCSVVMISIVELVLEFAEVSFGNATGAISALRAVRLLRVFKLARSWTSFRDLLQKMIITLKDIQNFSVLMFLFMFIYTLLGMEVYAYQIRFYDDDISAGILEDYDGPSVTPRANFNVFLYALVVIFIVFIGEDWNSSMYDAYRAAGSGAYVYFISLFIIGNLILLNLFLAILLKNFEEPPGGDDEEEEGVEANKSASVKKISILQKIKNIICCCCVKKEGEDTVSNDGLKASASDLSGPPGSIELTNKKNRRITPEKGGKKAGDEFSEDHPVLSDVNHPPDAAELAKIDESKHEDSMKTPRGEQEQLMVEKNLKYPITDSKPQLRQTQSNQEDMLITKLQKLSDGNNAKIEEEDNSGTGIKTKGGRGMRKQQTQDLEDNNKCETPGPMSMQSPQKSYMTGGHYGHSHSVRKKISRLTSDIPASEQFTLGQIKQQEVDEQQKPKNKQINLFGNSLFFMGAENKFRQFNKKIVSYQAFDNFILFLILISTALLIIENPLTIDPEGEEKKVLDQFDIVMTILFTIEMLIKIIVYGFIMNGEDSYMQNSWNIMDFVIVSFSLISIIFSDVDLAIFKLLRMLRVLRPLRMISRNPGLRIAIQSLINAAPDIGNVLIVSLLFVLLFAILAMNFFKGKYSYCVGHSLPNELPRYFDQWNCMDIGGDWYTEDQNFDNLGASVLTLFNVMTTEGWIGVMFNAVDSTEIYQQPYQDNFMYWTFYFVFFMIVGSLFVLNMFVGIVINVFNKEKETLQNDRLLTKTQSDWCECMIFIYAQQPIITFVQSGNKCIDRCYYLATSYWFDQTVFMCIVVNTLCMCINFYGRSQQLEYWLDITGIFFNIVYTCEFIIKFIGMGKDYFHDNWNNFDFAIVLSAWLGEISERAELPIGDVLTLIKTFRIFRIFKIIRKYKNLRILFYTLVGAIPQLTNIGLLLFLFIFLYAVLGVQSFSKVKLNGALDRNANFKSFGSAIKTLVRMATGESWHEIMYACAKQKSVDFYCTDSIEDEKFSYHKFINEYNSETYMCGSSGAILYFVTFMLMVSFIFLNLFIAIILESFINSQEEENLEVNQITMDSFNKFWSIFDNKGTGFIKVRDFPGLIKMLMEEELKQKYVLEKQVNEGSLSTLEMSQQIILFDLTKDEILQTIAEVKKEKIYEEIKNDESDDDDKNKKKKQNKKHQKHSKKQQKKRGSDSNSSLVESDNDDFLEQLKVDPDIREKQERRKALARIMNDFVAQLKLPVYDTIKYYQYYDVIEALTRNLFQNKIYQEQQKLFDEDLEKDSSSSCCSSDSSSAIFANDQDCGVCSGPPDIDKEQEEDIRNGNLQAILRKLEHKGKENNIHKFVEMQKLRSKRNKKANTKLDIFGLKNAIIDSSQIVGATVILRLIKKQVERARKRMVNSRMRQQERKGPGSYSGSQIAKGDLAGDPSKILSDQGRLDPTVEHGETQKRGQILPHIQPNMENDKRLVVENLHPRHLRNEAGGIVDRETHLPTGQGRTLNQPTDELDRREYRPIESLSPINQRLQGQNRNELYDELGQIRQSQFTMSQKIDTGPGNKQGEDPVPVGGDRESSVGIRRNQIIDFTAPDQFHTDSNNENNGHHLPASSSHPSAPGLAAAREGDHNVISQENIAAQPIETRAGFNDISTPHLGSQKVNSAMENQQEAESMFQKVERNNDTSLGFGQPAQNRHSSNPRR